MRLGRDVLIFTKNGGCQSVGMMSQTYLEKIKAQAVIVPIVPFNQQTDILHQAAERKIHESFHVPVFWWSGLNWASRSQVVTQDSENNLKAILEHSIVTSVEKLHAHFDSIPSKKGTKILIWNIRRSKKIPTNFLNLVLMYILFLFSLFLDDKIESLVSLWLILVELEEADVTFIAEHRGLEPSPTAPAGFSVLPGRRQLSPDIHWVGREKTAL